MSVKAAAQCGMGKGEYSANFANFRAIVVALAPMVYAQTYAIGVKSGVAGLPYYLAAMYAVVAELLKIEYVWNKLNVSFHIHW